MLMAIPSIEKPLGQAWVVHYWAATLRARDRPVGLSHGSRNLLVAGRDRTGVRVRAWVDAALGASAVVDYRASLCPRSA
jgi:hypothetical protein